MLGLAAAILFGHFVVYRGMIVPVLLKVKSVPVWMWAVQYGLEAVAVILAGVGLRSWREVLGYAVAAAVVREAVMYGLARAREPGHLKAFEAPALELCVALLVLAVLYAAALALVSSERRAGQRARTP